MKEVKPKRLSRRKLVESAIQYLEKETGYHSVNIRFGDGYLVDSGKDSVCWFCFKEIPGYTFAFWHKDIWNTKGFGPEFEQAELMLFTQADLTRDKFKPSRSCMKVPMFRYNFKDNNKDYWEETWNGCCGVKMIEFIHDHKYRAFYIQSFSEWLPWEYVSGFSAFIEYYRVRIQDWIEKKKEVYKLKKISKDIIMNLKNIDGLRATLSDYGDCYSPRLHLFVYLKSKLAKDVQEYNKVMDYLEDKYWNSVSIFYLETSKDFKKHLNYREKASGKDETLLWKKIN